MTSSSVTCGSLISCIVFLPKAPIASNCGNPKPKRLTAPNPNFFAISLAAKFLAVLVTTLFPICLTPEKSDLSFVGLVTLGLFFTVCVAEYVCLLSSLFELPPPPEDLLPTDGPFYAPP